MINKHMFLRGAAALLMSAFFAFECVKAVDVSRIDEVRKKEVLSDSDLAVIADFVTDGIDEMLNSIRLSDIAAARTAVTTRKTSSKESAQIQYGPEFLDAVHQNIGLALEQAADITDPQRKAMVEMNLMILIDSLEDPELARAALEKVGDDNVMIRYWAIHSVTNFNFIEKLNSTNEGETELAKEITNKLTQVTDNEQCASTLSLIARFVGHCNNSNCRSLLVQLADIRIAKYASWKVDNEQLDGQILKMLSEKIASKKSLSADKAILGQKFGQLYSYVIQRYILGENILTTSQKRALISVIVDGELYAEKMSSGTLGSIKRAIEKNDFDRLFMEHDSLLGLEAQAGELAATVGFNYGTNADGLALTAPAALPRPGKTTNGG